MIICIDYWKETWSQEEIKSKLVKNFSIKRCYKDKKITFSLICQPNLFNKITRINKNINQDNDLNLGSPMMNTVKKSLEFQKNIHIDSKSKNKLKVDII